MPEQPVYVRGRLSPRGIARLRRIFGWLYRLFTRIEVRGLETLPKSGGYLVVTNHLSRFDPPFIFITLQTQQRMAVFNASTYRKNLLFRVILEMFDVIWVNRGATSPSTIKAAIQALREGTILGIAPEGTRSPSGALQPGKTGAAYLAIAAGVPVVPVGLTHTEKMAGAIRRLRRITIGANYGPPFWLVEPGKRVRPDQATLEQATAEVMCRIAALLPPEYRGVYADHPRVRELLSGQTAPAAANAAGPAGAPEVSQTRGA